MACAKYSEIATVINFLLAHQSQLDDNAVRANQPSLLPSLPSISAVAVVTTTINCSRWARRREGGLVNEVAASRGWRQSSGWLRQAGELGMVSRRWASRRGGCVEGVASVARSSGWLRELRTASRWWARQGGGGIEEVAASSGRAGGGVARAASRMSRRRAVERVAALWSGGGGVEQTNALVEREGRMNGVQRVVRSRQDRSAGRGRLCRWVVTSVV